LLIPLVLWGVSWLFFKAKPVSLKDMDLSEIYVIEQENQEAKDLAAMNPETLSWWRKWLI
jgi:amino acid transporter